MEPIHRSETKAALDFVPVDLDRGESPSEEESTVKIRLRKVQTDSSLEKI